MTVMGSNRARIAAAMMLAGVATAIAACGSGTSDPAGADTKAAGQAKGLPEVIDCSFDKPAVRPANLILACADLGAEVDKITWKSWGADKAEGDGTERDNTCTPNCAAGHYVTKPVHVVLSEPVQPAGLYTKATTTDAQGKVYSVPLVKQR